MCAVFKPTLDTMMSNDCPVATTTVTATAAYPVFPSRIPVASDAGQSIDCAMDSVMSLASPNNIMVLSAKNNGLSTPA